MTDAELRALVRQAVARHLGTSAPTLPPHAPAAATHTVHPAAPWQQHASHQVYLSVVNADGACVIEPSVPCDHCGYCKSHGH